MRTGAGARTGYITAQPDSAVPLRADLVLALPAQTMADDTGPDPASILPMGSLFEGAQFRAFELLVLALRDRRASGPRPPYAAVFDGARDRLGARRIVMVGDTLHTDILGGFAAEMRTVPSPGTVF